MLPKSARSQNFPRSRNLFSKDECTTNLSSIELPLASAPHSTQSPSPPEDESAHSEALAISLLDTPLNCFMLCPSKAANSASEACSNTPTTVSDSVSTIRPPRGLLPACNAEQHDELYAVRAPYQNESFPRRFTKSRPPIPQQMIAKAPLYSLLGHLDFLRPFRSRHRVTHRLSTSWNRKISLGSTVWKVPCLRDPSSSNAPSWSNRVTRFGSAFPAGRAPPDGGAPHSYSTGG